MKTALIIFAALVIVVAFIACGLEYFRTMHKISEHTNDLENSREALRKTFEQKRKRFGNPL
jgi:Tfp pilus assembly protein PilO